MRNLIVLTFFSIIISASASKKSSIFVSIPVQKYIFEQIAGPTITVESLLGESDNPHSFSVTPNVIKSIASCDAYFQVGIPFEAVIIAKIIGSGQKVKFYPHDKGIKRRHIKTAHKCSSGCVHDISELDPHYWISSDNVVKMAETSAEFLIKQNPKRKVVFTENLASFKKKISDLKQKNYQNLKKYKGNSFYVYHPAFGYFADEIGLTQKAVEVEGKKPSPRQLIKLVNEAKAAKIKTIIVQNQFDRNAAEKLAKMINGNVIEINPMQENIYQLLQSLGNAVEAGFKK